MSRNFYILIIVSSSLFFISCRATKTETESAVYAVEAQGPSDYWYWQGPLDFDKEPVDSDWHFYEEQLVALEKRHEIQTNKLETQIDGLQAENERLRDEDRDFRQLLKVADELLERSYRARTKLLETTIKIMQIENQQTQKAIAKLENKIVQLETQIDHRKTWPSFWTELKTEDPNDFQMVENTLAEFVSQYLYAACYITVADLKAELREVIVDGEIETSNKTYFGGQNHVEEEENQKIISEESSQECKEESNQDQDCQEEKHRCEKSIWHHGQKQSCQN